MSRVICLDASIVAKWAFPEELQHEALELRSAHDAVQVGFVAPEHFSVERVSTVRHKLAQGGVDFEAALRALRLLCKIEVTLVSMDAVAERTLAIAHQLGESCWDAAYIAVAETEDCDFWTADKDLARKAKPHFPFVKLLGEDTLEGDHSQ